MSGIQTLIVGVRETDAYVTSNHGAAVAGHLNGTLHDNSTARVLDSVETDSTIRTTSLVGPAPSVGEITLVNKGIGR